MQRSSTHLCGKLHVALLLVSAVVVLGSHLAALQDHVRGVLHDRILSELSLLPAGLQQLAKGLQLLATQALLCA